MTYTVVLAPHAFRAMKKLPADVRRRLQPAIDTLASTPRPADVRKLSGTEDIYRIRVDDYRILYEIQDAVLRVLVIEVGHRREVYRR
jgi:mRNA interferase RelE/StbE